MVNVEDINKLIFSRKAIPRPSRLIKSKRIRRYLELDRKEFGYPMHKACFTAYLDAQIDPPSWFIDEMKKKAYLYMLKECYERNKNHLLVSIFGNMIAMKEKVPEYLHPILKALNLPTEVYESLTQ